jgi:NhaP-type Na+/H+ and K+/H+ antiporter
VVFSFISIGEEGFFSIELLVLVSGLLLLLFLSKSDWVDHKLSILINKALKRYTDLDVRDYYSLLHLEEEYQVLELEVSKNDWLEGRQLSEPELDEEGVTALGIRREDGTFLGAPDGNREIKKNDIVITYGRGEGLESMENSKKGSSGEKEHEEKKEEQKEVEKEEEEKEKKKEAKEAAQEEKGKKEEDAKKKADKGKQEKKDKDKEKEKEKDEKGKKGKGKGKKGKKEKKKQNQGGTQRDERPVRRRDRTKRSG